MKKRLIRCEIRYDGRGFWYFRELNKTWHIKGDSRLGGDRPSMTKIAFVRAVIFDLKQRVVAGEYGFSLWICDRYGKYQSERTYPRSADSRRSKG